MNLIGKQITYFDDETIVADVIGDKQVKFEGKTWRVSPLTREIETRKGRCTQSGKYWGIDKWMYQGKKLQDLMEEVHENQLDETDKEDEDY